MSSVSSMETKCDSLVFVMCSSYPVYIIIIIVLVAVAVAAVAVFVCLYSRVCLLAREFIQESNSEYLRKGACAVGLPLCFRVFSIFVMYGYKQSGGRGDM
jgi:hypothetical protein